MFYKFGGYKTGMGNNFSIIEIIQVYLLIFAHIKPCFKSLLVHQVISVKAVTNHSPDYTDENLYCKDDDSNVFIKTKTLSI